MFQQLTRFLRKWVNPRIRPAAWWPGRYTRVLEDEVARLRAENRALINSILSVAGIPPMRVAGHIAPPTLSRRRSETGASETAEADLRRPSSSSGEGAQPAPTRRRSWQQIGRALEAEDARAAQREHETDTGTFPKPRGVIPRV